MNILNEYERYINFTSENHILLFMNPTNVCQFRTFVNKSSHYEVYILVGNGSSKINNNWEDVTLHPGWQVLSRKANW